MPDRAAGLSLLEELDARQDELLDELERLNRRIEQVIAEWTASTTNGATVVPAAA
jgi:hypothetical protein